MSGQRRWTLEMCSEHHIGLTVGSKKNVAEIATPGNSKIVILKLNYKEKNKTMEWG